MTKENLLEYADITENEFLGIDAIIGNLFLNNLTSIPEGFNLKVGRDLYLDSLTSIPEGFNPNVGGSLILCKITSIPDSFNPIVGGSLYLGYLTSIPEGFNPIVSGGLFLENLISIPDGFNPTVGGNLYLENLKYINHTKLNGQPLFWQDGKYISVDGIFVEVVKKRGNVHRVKRLNNPIEFYLITDGQGKWAHGDTLNDAKEDLIYKISNRNKKDYEDLSLDSVFPFEEAIECYRVITGACSFGVKHFVKKFKVEHKDYTIEEMIDLTKDSYGGQQFKHFFQ